jgi:hypothetical protein
LTHLPNELAELFVGVNRTELYQICRRNGLAVPPGHSSEAYIGWLTGEVEPPEDGGVIDSWREGLIRFIGDYWMRLRPQLTCPAKDLKDSPNPNPKPCFGCSDAQVITCVVGRNEQIIDNLRPRKT